MYILVKYHENILKRFNVTVCTEFYSFGRFWEITPEGCQLELSFLYVTCHLSVLYNLVKFRDDISKGIQVMANIVLYNAYI